MIVFAPGGGKCLFYDPLDIPQPDPNPNDDPVDIPQPDPNPNDDPLRYPPVEKYSTEPYSTTAL